VSPAASGWFPSAVRLRQTPLAIERNDNVAGIQARLAAGESGVTSDTTAPTAFFTSKNFALSGVTSSIEMPM